MYKEKECYGDINEEKTSLDTIEKICKMLPYGVDEI